MGSSKRVGNVCFSCFLCVEIPTQILTNNVYIWQHTPSDSGCSCVTYFCNCVMGFRNHCTLLEQLVALPKEQPTTRCHQSFSMFRLSLGQGTTECLCSMTYKPGQTSHWKVSVCGNDDQKNLTEMENSTCIQTVCLCNIAERCSKICSSLCECLLFRTEEKVYVPKRRASTAHILQQGNVCLVHVYPKPEIKV